jgi:hypothetical protein
MSKYTFRFSLLSLLALLLLACGPSKLAIQEMAVDADLMLEFRYIENDSIGIQMGNMLVLNTSKTSGVDFYPLLVSTRSPDDIDKPTATHILENDSDLLTYLQRGKDSFTRFGVVIGENCSKDPAFSEKNAIDIASRLAKQIPGSSLTLFREKGGDIVAAKKLF